MMTKLDILRLGRSDPRLLIYCFKSAEYAKDTPGHKVLNRRP